jgi:hypothetical protein
MRDPDLGPEPLGQMDDLVGQSQVEAVGVADQDPAMGDGDGVGTRPGPPGACRVLGER